MEEKNKGLCWECRKAWSVHYNLEFPWVHCHHEPKDKPIFTPGSRSCDPDVSKWGINEMGLKWYNTTDYHNKSWDGEKIVII